MMGNVLGAHTPYTSFRRDGSHSALSRFQQTGQSSVLVQPVQVDIACATK